MSCVYLLRCFGLFTSYCGGVLSALILKYCHKPITWHVIILVSVLFPVLICCAILDDAAMEMQFYTQQNEPLGPFLIGVIEVILYCALAFPFVLMGTHTAAKMSVSVQVNPVPNTTPPEKWYTRPYFTALVCGGLTFGAMALEWKHLMKSSILHEVSGIDQLCNSVVLHDCPACICCACSVIV